MFSPFKRWYEFFNSVGKENNTDFIIVIYGRKRKYSCYLGHNISFIADLCPKITRTAYINKQHYGEFPFFLKNFYIREVKTGCDIPVNTSYVITILIFPYFTEGNPASLKGTMIFTGKYMPA